jgi:hypothetical protein
LDTYKAATDERVRALVRRDDLDRDVRGLNQVVDEPSLRVVGDTIPPQHRDVRDRRGTAERQPQLGKRPGKAPRQGELIDPSDEEALEHAVPGLGRHLLAHDPVEILEGRLFLRQTKELVQPDPLLSERHLRLP